MYIRTYLIKDEVNTLHATYVCTPIHMGMYIQYVHTYITISINVFFAETNT